MHKIINLILCSLLLSILPQAALAIDSVVEDPDYKIQAGDVLQITVWKEDNMDREVLVLPDGTIDFPLIGSFKAQGQTPAQLRGTIKRKLSSLIPDASIAVVVKATLGHSISVIGQVNKPGEVIMGHKLSVCKRRPNRYPANHRRQRNLDSIPLRRCRRR